MSTERQEALEHARVVGIFPLHARHEEGLEASFAPAVCVLRSRASPGTSELMARVLDLIMSHRVADLDASANYRLRWHAWSRQSTCESQLGKRGRYTCVCSCSAAHSHSRVETGAAAVLQ